MYEDYNAMKEAIEKVKNNIQKNGYPSAFTPMVFAVTGTGRVA